MFENSRGIVFRDTNLTNAQTINQHYHTDGFGVHRNAIQVFEEHVAFDALFDADARFDPPKCHPDTRSAVLNRIDNWLHELDSSTPVIWLRGAAGAGKSAIAQTLAERWNERRTLAASFFFSRTALGRSGKKCLIPTLAYQLTLSVPSTRPHIEDVLHRDIGILKKNLQTQITELLIRPLALAVADASESPHIVIIDGLDECCVDSDTQHYEEQQREILEAITFAVQQNHFPLRFLIASRPERQIRECFGQQSLKGLTSPVVLDHTMNPDEDIKLFLECRFDEIRRKHAYLGPSWPPPGTIDKLVKKSSGQFIYAAVTMRYIDSPRSDPEASLQTIMGVSGSSATSQRNKPFAELDALYLYILRSIAPPSLPIVIRIFELLLDRSPPYGLFHPLIDGVANTEIKRLSPAFIAAFLFTSLGQVYLHLVDLHSILDIPPEVDSERIPILFIHASFSEFLADRSRSEDFYIDKRNAHLRLQLLRMKHVFLLSLSVFSLRPDIQYSINGMPYELGIGLDQEYQPLSKELSDGLEALIAGDKTYFYPYLNEMHFDENSDLLKQKFVLSQYVDKGTLSKYCKRCRIANGSASEGTLKAEIPVVQPPEEPANDNNTKKRSPSSKFRQWLSRLWRRRASRGKGRA